MAAAASESGAISKPRNSPRRSRSPIRVRTDAVSTEKDLTEDLQDSTDEMRKAIVTSMLPEIKARLQHFADTGLTRPNEFDLRAFSALMALPVSMQHQVFDYLEDEKVFFLNARSKSGFLVASCERARQGLLDVRGFFCKDPWREYLLSVARPKAPEIQLVPEKDWLGQHGNEPAKLLIDVSVDSTVGTKWVTLAINLTQSPENIKQRLTVIGVQIPVNKMKLRAAHVGFLKNEHSLAFYNLQSGSELVLMKKTRAGTALKKDQSDGYDPALCDGVHMGSVFASYGLTK